VREKIWNPRASRRPVPASFYKPSSGFFEGTERPPQESLFHFQQMSQPRNAWISRGQLLMTVQANSGAVAELEHLRQISIIESVINLVF
jgi:hypothetical protein